MAASQPTEADPKDRFFRYFRHEVTALTEQIDRLNTISPNGGERNDAIDHCLAGIDRLSHEVKDASSYIPAYDQRTYGEAVKALSEKLQTTRTSFNPPRKFQFKTRKNASAISLSDAAELAQTQKLRAPIPTSDTSNTNSSFAPTPLDRLSPKDEDIPDPITGASTAASPNDGISDAGGGIRKPSFSHATQVSLTHHKGIHIILPTSASHATSSGTLSHLRNCVIDLALPTAHGAPFAALYLKSIARSLVVCGHVAGAAHVTDVTDCVLVASCRQFRMHGARNVVVYLHCASRPIIEDCEGVRFAPLPRAYATQDTDKVQNQWDQIDDFKWLQAGPSPNFGLLPEEQRVEESVWKEKVPGGHGEALEQILRAVGVPV